MSKKSVAVQIAGHSYKILSDGDAETLRELARYVDRAMDRVRQRTGTVDTLDVSVLTCLNLAREIMTLRDQQSDGGAAEGRLRSLIERVEGAIAQRDSGETGVDVRESRSTRRAGGSDVSAGSSRTLDLPSVEALRERSTSEQHEAEPAEAMPTARAASGGRDRAS
jgi:cell division protein ZapA (FtsZ GTPase activity inhibitor)